ncbi:MAG TPA: beta-ketoacyl synthase N-terminal-like domain-containing protein [Thermoanaerobaculia bacterium]|nr:beta-ketoacyl synthase N-terminal-like domain-containing protein [Thermoanaerobaculia bacterium]
MSPVVVTGLGTVLSCGAGAEALAAALEAGEPALAEIDRSAGQHPPRASRLAALAQHVDLSPWLAPGRARRMSWPSRYAVAAATLALDSARLPAEARAGGTLAVALGTAFGTARYAEEMVRAILLQGPEAASPFHFSESVANAPAAQVAIACAARGANVAVTQREAGPPLAVALAAREVELGRCDWALAGATEEINPLVHAVLARFRALARPEADGGEAARPFDRRRTGFLAAEGSSVLLLEREEEARRRGAPLLARVRGWERGFDPTAAAHGWGRDPRRLADRLRRGLRRMGLTPDDLDLVVSGASGSVGGDRLEAGVLRALWPAGPPPVLAPKAVSGEYAGGQLAAAVLALGGRGLAPTAGFAEPDPDLGVTPWAGGPLPPPRRLLASALAVGGAAAWLVLEAA